MNKNILKVYDEDLINNAINVANVPSYKVVEAGSTEGALCVNVFAKGYVSIAQDVTISVTHSDSENGTFTTAETFVIAATKTFSDGDLMASFMLPVDVKDYVTATAQSSTSNVGGMRVTLGYLAR